MLMQRILALSLWFGLLAFTAAPNAAAQNTNVFDLREGDRVVLLGDTLIEREATDGFIEHTLTTQFPERNVIFRNLGWSADTPEGQSRMGFDHSKAPDFWFKQLTNSVALLKPTVVFVGYGMANSFDGDAGLLAFMNKYVRLLDALQQNAGTNAIRFVLLSPVPHEKLGGQWPDPAKHNAQLAACTKAIKSIASQRSAHFIDLFAGLDQGQVVPPPAPFTDNGIHLNRHGYRCAAEVIAAGLGWEPHAWRVGVLANGKVREGSYGATILETDLKPESLRLVIQTEQLVLPPWATGESPLPVATPINRVQTPALKPGRYDLKIDGQFVRSVSDVDIRSGLFIEAGAPFEQSEELRQAILKKNNLYFNSWRPQNNTYLFLFRKHEQGQNALEIPQFNGFIMMEEQRIARLRQPRRHVIELVPSSPENAAAKKAAPVAPEPAPRTMLPVPQFDIDPNLEITLYAENPLLAKPIHMNFDERGRLWVASSEIYPQIKPGQIASDKILVLEDTDGDGKAEKSTVFADGLLIPTGVLPGDGGVYVAASTEVLHFRDTDGDGRADERRVVLSGFGTEDTHHILHTLRWGVAGELWMNQSIYIHTHMETPHGVMRLNSGGILGLRPRSGEMGILMKGLVNSWGHILDDFGQSFATDGAGGEGINWVIPQAMYVTYAGGRRIMNSVSPGSYPKFCSLEMIRSPHFPDDWQGNLITCDFRAHRVVRFAVDEQDAGYVTRAMPDIVRTRDVAFRPIDVKLGPDGALYIADWSNPIIQHGEVDFRDPRRDHEHGRIWRVSYKGRKPAPKTDLTKASTKELMDNLTSPNLFTCEQSRRLLNERGTNALADLSAWTQAQTTEPNLLAALWLYQAIDRVEPKLLERLLEAKDGRVRAAAVRVLAGWQERLGAERAGLRDPFIGWPSAPLPLAHRSELPTARALELLALRVVDAHPRVRLEAVRALARIPDVRAVDLALKALEQPVDRFLDYALWLTVNDQSEPWLAALKSGAWKTEGREKQLEFALKAIEPAQANAVMAQLLGDNKPLPRDGSGPWIELIGKAGSPKELRRLFDQVLQSGFDDEVMVRALGALTDAARLRNARPQILSTTVGIRRNSPTDQTTQELLGNLTAVGFLLEDPREAVRIAALRLAGAWRELGHYTRRLAGPARSKDTSPALREAIFNTLREQGTQEAIDVLVPLADKTNTLALRRQAVVALAGLQPDRPGLPLTNLHLAFPAAVEVLMETTSDTEALEFWRALLGNKGASAALTKALPKSGLPQPVAKAGLRAAREGGRSEPELVLALTRSSGLDEGEVTLTEAELKQMASDVLKKGDPARGEVVYRRKDLSCVNCHAIGGAGGKVGPDMTSIGASAPVDYLIESVWFPNRKIKEGYHAVMVESKDGQELSGVLVRENSEQLVLRDATGREVSVAKANVAERRLGTLSLMPAGLIDGITAQERIDLFRFLSELGKPGPYDATRGSIARAWRVRPGLHTMEQFGEEKLVADVAADKGWTPVLANVDGGLPAARIEEAVQGQLGLVGIYAVARLQVSGRQEVSFKVSAAAEGVWVDGKKVAPEKGFKTELSAGAHTILFRLDAGKLPESLRLESSAGNFLTE